MGAVYEIFICNEKKNELTLNLFLIQLRKTRKNYFMTIHFYLINKMKYYISNMELFIYLYIIGIKKKREIKNKI